MRLTVVKKQRRQNAVVEQYGIIIGRRSPHIFASVGNSSYLNPLLANKGNAFTSRTEKKREAAIIAVLAKDEYGAAATSNDKKRGLVLFLIRVP